MTNGVPRTKEKETRIAEIENAAKEVFFSKGYEAATIQEIAESAGIAKGTVYLYYKSKEDLYSALLATTTQNLRLSLTALLEEVDNKKYRTGEEFMIAFADRFVDLHYGDPGLHVIYQKFLTIINFKTISGDTFDLVTKEAKENFQLLRKLLSRAIELGLIQDVDVVKTVDTIWGLFVGVAQVEWNKLKWTQKDHLRDTLRYAFSLMCSGLSTEKRSGGHSST